MAGNTVVLEFAGDATKLAKEAGKANQNVDKFGKGVLNASKDVEAAGKVNDDYLTKVGKLGAGVDGLSTAIDNAGQMTQAFADIQDSARQKTLKHERALVDVMQAQEDYNQALRDGSQAAIDSGQAEIDLEQAKLDQKTALQDYNKAVKEHGKNSLEAAQALIDLKQAGQDVTQANEDQEQSARDQQQATIDAKNATLDLNDAQHEAKPPDTQKWADDIAMFTPILTGLVGILGLVTTAQWLWNAAQLASPMTWIVIGILLIIAGIVLLVKNWDKVKEVGGKAWGWIKDKAKDFWNWLKDVPGKLKDLFKKVSGFITAPFKAAFNFIADGWNKTIGSLSWTVPGWIPGIGGNNISVPKIPKFHSGIDSVPGAPGSEMLAVLQAGERVTPAGSNHGEMASVTVMLDGDVLVDAISKIERRRFG